LIDQQVIWGYLAQNRYRGQDMADTRRKGGRAARKALHEAPTPDEERAVRSGISGGSYSDEGRLLFPRNLMYRGFAEPKDSPLFTLCAWPI